MNWKMFKSSFKKKNKKHIMMLKDNIIYATGNYIFCVRGDCEYDEENGSSIPYYWLVDLDYEKYHKESSLGLPRNIYIYEPKKIHIDRAKNIMEKSQISFKNVERLIFESKRKLDEAIQMLYKVKNGQEQQG